MPTLTYGDGLYGDTLYAGDTAIAETTIWPAATTFPDTTQYPGQGGVPFIRCYLSRDDYQSASRTFVDYSNRLRSWRVDRGRPNELQQFDAGTAEIALTNRDRELDPNVLTGAGRLRPMNKVWLYAEMGGATYDLFTGYAESFVQTWPDGGWSDALTTIRCVDEYKVINNGVVPDGTTLQGFPGPRIGSVLDAITNRAPRFLPAGTNEMYPKAMVDDGPAAEEISLAVRTESEYGAFFITASGTARLYTGIDRVVATIKTLFHDDGSQGFPYLDLTMDYSDAFLANEVAVTPVHVLPTETASDATSLSRYGKRRMEVTTDPLDHFTVASLAASLLAKYKEPAQRVTSLEPDTGDPNTLLNMLARELLDKILIYRTPPTGAPPIDATSYIQNITWSGEPGEPPKLKLGVSPL